MEGQRILSADPLRSRRLHYRPMPPGPDAMTLANIQRQAFEAWSQPNTSSTTYGHFHSEKRLDEPTRLRPTSPTRKNRPHCSLVFMTNHVQGIPGFFDCKKHVSSEPYRVDGSVPPEEQRKRQLVREKYTARPHTAAVMQFREQFSKVEDELREIYTPVEAQAATAWLRAAEEEDRNAYMKKIREEETQRKAEVQVSQMEMRDADQTQTITPRPPVKHVGWKLPEATHYPPDDEHPSEQPRPWLLRSQSVPRGYSGRPALRTKESTIRVKRREYLIHPDWPDTLPHHRIPPATRVVPVQYDDYKNRPPYKFC